MVLPDHPCREFKMADQKQPALKKGEKIVNITCRAQDKCPGQRAVMWVIKQNAMGTLAGGGRQVMYTCQHCGQSWHIST